VVAGGLELLELPHAASMSIATLVIAAPARRDA
jgi:hypothetical protein